MTYVVFVLYAGIGVLVRCFPEHHFLSFPFLLLTVSEGSTRRGMAVQGIIIGISRTPKIGGYTAVVPEHQIKTTPSDRVQNARFPTSPLKKHWQIDMNGAVQKKGLDEVVEHE